MVMKYNQRNELKNMIRTYGHHFQSVVSNSDCAEMVINRLGSRHKKDLMYLRLSGRGVIYDC